MVGLQLYIGNHPLLFPSFSVQFFPKTIIENSRVQIFLDFRIYRINGGAGRGRQINQGNQLFVVMSNTHAETATTIILEKMVARGMSGFISPLSRVRAEQVFHAVLARSTNFNNVCRVRGEIQAHTKIPGNVLTSQHHYYK